MGAETHEQALRELVPLTQGSILEIGVGYSSTPLLRELAEGRDVVSVDNSMPWIQEASRLVGDRPLGRFVHVEDWNDLVGFLGDQRFGFALVDHAPGHARGPVLAQLRERDLVDVIVVHDTDLDTGYFYVGVEEELSRFRFRREFPGSPRTTAVSNGVCL